MKCASTVQFDFNVSVEAEEQLRLDDLRFRNILYQSQDVNQEAVDKSQATENKNGIKEGVPGNEKRFTIDWRNLFRRNSVIMLKRVDYRTQNELNQELRGKQEEVLDDNRKKPVEHLQINLQQECKLNPKRKTVRVSENICKDVSSGSGSVVEGDAMPSERKSKKLKTNF